MANWDHWKSNFNSIDHEGTIEIIESRVLNSIDL